jgi:hypothetical protein
MLITLSLVTSLLTAAPAAPLDAHTVKAKAAFEAAKKLYAQARYPEAIAKFEEAYLAKPHPSIYFNIGKCHEQLGETPKALRAYRDYLRLAPDAPDVNAVSDAISNMEKRLREKGVQQLIVFVEPANAKISVDGKLLGGSPSSIELEAGNHKLSIQAEGFESQEKSFVMSTARAVDMNISLRPMATPAIPTATTKAENKANETKPVETKTDVPKKEEQAKLTPEVKKETPIVVAAVEPVKKGRVFTWVASGLAVAAGGTAVVTGLMSNGTYERAALAAKANESEKFKDLQGALATQGTIANVSMVTAGVAAAAAVVLFFVEGN